MNKKEMKDLISKEFGFSTSKINLLEASKNSFGKYDYIMFEVCDIEYQMRYLYDKFCYVLHVFDNGKGRLDI